MKKAKTKFDHGIANPAHQEHKENKVRNTHQANRVNKATSFKSSMPSLDQLAQKEDTVKVTLSLTKASVEYFKNEAVKREVCYQVMIRNLIDEYVKHCLNQIEK